MPDQRQQSKHYGKLLKCSLLPLQASGRRQQLAFVSLLPTLKKKTICSFNVFTIHLKTLFSLPTKNHIFDRINKKLKRYLKIVLVQHLKSQNNTTCFTVMSLGITLNRIHTLPWYKIVGFAVSTFPDYIYYFPDYIYMLRI